MLGEPTVSFSRRAASQSSIHSLDSRVSTSRRQQRHRDDVRKRLRANPIDEPLADLLRESVDRDVTQPRTRTFI